jgi:hypothetical protein
MAMKNTQMRGAIRAALLEEMRRDDRVFVMGGRSWEMERDTPRNRRLLPRIW